MSKTYEELALQHNFLDGPYGCSQHVAMQEKIEDVMSGKDRQATGLSKLSPVELQKLNAWLETNVGKLHLPIAKQAPVGGGHGPG